MIYWTLFKRFAPYIALAIAILAVFAWHRGEVRNSYKLGVADTENAQAEVVARVRYENEKREAELAKFVAVKQVELEGKNRENESLTLQLADVARTSRLCLADSVRRDALPAATGTSRWNNGTAVDNRPTETIGEAIVAIVSECQRSTDKLVTLQGYFHELKSKAF